MPSQITDECTACENYIDIYPFEVAIEDGDVFKINPGKCFGCNIYIVNVQIGQL